MVNTQYLEKLIAEKGLKKSFIANQMGISVQTLKKKCTNNGDFYTNEVTALCSILGISDMNEVEKIFFVNVGKCGNVGV